MLWLLLISIVFAALNSVFLHKAKLSNGSSIYKFNLLCSLVWCFCLLIVNGCKLHLTKNVILFGVIYGTTQALFILFKTAAMNNGPVSITTLIGNCSLIISVLVCLFLWDEKISFADIIGLTLLILGIIFCTYKNSEQNYNTRWKIYTLLFLIFAASVGITFKAFSKVESAVYAGDMMLVAAMVMIVTYFVISLIMGGWNLNNNIIDKKEGIQFVGYALISGLLSCVYNRLNIYLSGVLDGVIFFPSFNGGVILLSTILSVLLIKERLQLKQILGIFIGIAGICIIGIF